MINALTSAEREAIGLCVCCDALANLVGSSMFRISAIEAGVDEVEVQFHSCAHQNLFLIRLLDFTSEDGGMDPLGDRASCLGVLRQAATQRRLRAGETCEELTSSVSALVTWLEAPVGSSLPLPAIGPSAHISLTQHQILWLIGNQANHGPSKLAVASEEIRSWLLRQGHQPSIEQMPFLLRRLREHLSRVVCRQHITKAAELLTDIRWGLQSYLTPLFIQCLRADEGNPMGRFDAPDRVTPGSSAHRWFSHLMNHVRSGGAIPPFRASPRSPDPCSSVWQGPSAAI